MNEQLVSLRPLQFGFSLGTSLFVFYLACLALSIVVPDRGLHQAWLQFYPGFAWTPLGMLIGAIESFAFGLIAGLVFAPIANFFRLFRSR
jgi:hypothetical protein